MTSESKGVTYNEFKALQESVILVATVCQQKGFHLSFVFVSLFQLDHVVFLLFHSHVYIRGHYQHHERKSPFRKSHHLKVEEKQICKKYCQHLSDSICLCLQNNAFFKVNKCIYLSVYLRLMSVKMKKIFLFFIASNSVSQTVCFQGGILSAQTQDVTQKFACISSLQRKRVHTVGLERSTNSSLSSVLATVNHIKIQWSGHSESSLGSNYILSAGCLYKKL